MSEPAPPTSAGPLPLPDRAGAKPAADALPEAIPGAVIVAVIAVLVVVVSMPRFRDHVVRTNRADAPTALRLLGASAFDDSWANGLEADALPRTVHELVLSIDALRHRFRDGRPVQGSTTFEHHGYLFDTGNVLDGPRSRPALVAWPVEFGRTGDAAFAFTAEGSVWVHRNGGLWTGVESPLVDVAISDEGWTERAPR
ncbi:MAG: hypothetical protein AAFU73_03210 [Planctomycetota bacterium]